MVGWGGGGPSTLQAMNYNQNQLSRELLDGPSYTGLLHIDERWGGLLLTIEKQSEMKYYGRLKFMDKSKKCKLIEEATRLCEFRSG